MKNESASKSRIMEADMELSSRKRRILIASVEDYIRDCAPITSGNLKESKDMGCSSATLRAELNALEAMGFLRQLHTSGGRVPTAQGYRFYAENMLKDIKATDHELDSVRALIENRTQSLSEIVSGIAKIVSHATNYPTVVVMNGAENLILKDFKIVPLMDEKIMVLIGTNSGYITQNLDIKATIDECNDASNYLTKYFKGESLGYLVNNIDFLSGSMNSEIKAFQNIVKSLTMGLKKFNEKRHFEVQTEGAAKLLENQKDIGGAKKVIKLLEDEDELFEVVDGKEEDVTIKVADDENDDCSVVKAPIKVDGEQLAVVGVIGPQRMDYVGIATALKVIVDELNKKKGG